MNVFSSKLITDSESTSKFTYIELVLHSSTSAIAYQLIYESTIHNNIFIQGARNTELKQFLFLSEISSVDSVFCTDHEYVASFFFKAIF